MVRKAISMMTASFVALATASTAMAQTPGGYVGEGGEVQQRVSGEGTGVLGQLPFTGLDLALIVGAGLLLILLGVGLRRLNSRPTA